MSVLQRFQRQGLGRELLSQAEEYAKSLAQPFLWLTAWSANHKACAFYQAQGYTDVGVSDYSYKGEIFRNRIYQKILESFP